jgi:hypothetical protein
MRRIMVGYSLRQSRHLFNFVRQSRLAWHACSGWSEASATCATFTALGVVFVGLGEGGRANAAKRREVVFVWEESKGNSGAVRKREEWHPHWGRVGWLLKAPASEAA